MTRIDAARLAFGIFFILAGALHLLMPGFYEKIVPSYLPAPSALVLLSGVAEMVGGVGLLLPRFRRAAGIGLIVLLVAVFPANVEMLRLARARGVSAWAEAALWLRLPLQALLIWWAWLLSGASRQPRSG